MKNPMIFEKIIWKKRALFWENIFVKEMVTKKRFGKFLWKVSWGFLLWKDVSKNPMNFYNERGFCIKNFFWKNWFWKKKDLRKCSWVLFLFFKEIWIPKIPWFLRKRNTPLKFCLFKRFILLNFLKEAPMW